MSNIMLERSGMVKRFFEPKQTFFKPLRTHYLRQPKFFWPYNHPYKEHENRGIAMTAVIGIRCRDGIVIAADRQITVPNSHKYEKC